MNEPLKNGAPAIHNIQTGTYAPTKLGECTLSQVDLREHEEIVVWDTSLKEGEGDWAEPPPEPNLQQQLLMDIRAYLDAAIDKTDQLESML